MAPPQIIFGTASFKFPNTAWQDAEAVRELLRTLRDLGVTRLDSAASYPPKSPGRAEELLGETKEAAGNDTFLIDTKIATDIRHTGGRGELTKQAIEASTAASLERLQRPEGINILHIHSADPTTPLEEQARSFHEQISQGHCKAVGRFHAVFCSMTGWKIMRDCCFSFSMIADHVISSHKWGVSNVPPSMLEKMLQLCDQHGWTKPVCYQGPYNLVTRGMEKGLLPLLRAHNMAFNSFHSLAAGFLTGKLIRGEHAGTRFGDDHPSHRRARQMFGGQDLINAMKMFDADVKAHGLTSTEVAYRWLAYHSSLREDDGIIIGASRLEQVTETVGLIRKGPLPDDVVSLAKGLWESVKGTRGNNL
ncbi:Aldo/keto reductase [Apiospora rasikravindrae]|uniref:Aldo/keto reductase n=1 Tax=Apiospora rasikravindrae TaxID=990691 RepID=A0ABR1U2K8_9PEZI